MELTLWLVMFPRGKPILATWEEKGESKSSFFLNLVNLLFFFNFLISFSFFEDIFLFGSLFGSQVSSLCQIMMTNYIFIFIYFFEKKSLLC